MPLSSFPASVYYSWVCLFTHECVSLHLSWACLSAWGQRNSVIRKFWMLLETGYNSAPYFRVEAERGVPARVPATSFLISWTLGLLGDGSATNQPGELGQITSFYALVSSCVNGDHNSIYLLGFLDTSCFIIIWSVCLKSRLLGPR